ncbi:MAG: chemotaxis protein CheW [Candidatus Competibacter sp.]|nr:chemotaxis protein CheW [Candidatus Competibacteraceae bacterium]MBK7983148.1 chemotaxis protein CheW [Candidatus Competibacteraceae bacterium]MBK8962112.1 chemotaxis protein CheW [Candidatus Competibacteraceae bacterium]
MISNVAPIERRRARYGFRIGGLGLLIGQDTTSQVLEHTQVYPLPNTPVWLLGLINLRGNLTPIFDIKDFLQLENQDTSEKRRLLILDQAEKAVGILIDGLPHTAMTQHVLTRLPPLPAVLEPYVAKAYAQDAMIWLEFDHQGFFQTLGGLLTTA